MSLVICLLMITSVSASITQNVGQPQIPVQSGPGPTSSGSGGLADSPWPMFRQNLNHTGVSPYNTSANNGQLIWTFTTGAYLMSSPAINSDGTIFIGSVDNKLYAINPDGTLKWSFTTGDMIEWSSPAIDSNGTIYVGSHDNNLYAINPNGTEKWRIESGSNVNSPPTINSDGTIYICLRNKFFAINPDGTEKWNISINSHTTSAAAVGSDGTIYVGSSHYELYAINPNGTQKWSFKTGNEVFSSPAIGSDGTIYVGSADSKLYAINPNGSEKWNLTTGGGISSSPAIGSDGTIYVGSQDNKLYAINPDGTERWRFTTGDFIYYSSPAISSDGTIYIGSGDYNLYAINPDGTKKWSFKEGRGFVSSPAIGTDGTIYIGGWDHKLYAIGTPTLNLDVAVTSHFTTLNSAAQSSITVHVTDGTNPVQGATVNLVSDNGGIFSPQSGITDSNGDFKSIFNAPTITSQIICKISAEASKTGYNDGSGYVDITIIPIPWPMFNQNLNHTGLSPYDTSGNDGQLKWSFTTGDGVYSSPAIGSDETIYIGSYDHKLYAINPDGTEKWNFTTGERIYSSPAIDSYGTIYITSMDGNFYAINPDGTKKWNYTIGWWLWDASPTIGADGAIYIGSLYDQNLYAINPDGTLKWTFFIGEGWGVRSTPAISSDGTIYFGSGNGKLYAIKPDGTEDWSILIGDRVHSSPTIGTDGTIYVGCNDEPTFHAINPDGTIKWSFDTGSPLRPVRVMSTPSINPDGTIYFGSYPWVFALNPDGSEKWRFTTGNTADSSPAIGADGTIYIGSENHNVYAINPDGTEKWIFPTGNWIFSSPAIGTDGTIYIGSHDNKLYAIGSRLQNQPPVPDAGADQTTNEGDFVQFDASSSYDPDGTIETYEWDFDVSDGLWWETGGIPDATSPTPIHTYGDDGVFIVTLRVTDNDNLSATDTCNVTVQNVNPTVSIESITMNVEIGLRVAGRKYNNVSMTLYKDDSPIGYVSIERLPGSPDEQMAWIPVSINFSKSYSATVTYIPEDPPNVGANPVWIYLKSSNGSIKKIPHTFNVQQSKKRDSDHWNHLEPWEVELNAHFIGLPLEIISHITDPGSDDEILTFTYGSQVKTVTYLNNPPNLDMYASPEVNPVDIMDTTTLVYEGPGTVILVVKDDDNIRLGVGEGTDYLSVG